MVQGSNTVPFLSMTRRAGRGAGAMLLAGMLAVSVLSSSIAAAQEADPEVGAEEVAAHEAAHHDTQAADEAHGHGGELTMARIWTNPRFLMTFLTFVILVGILVFGYKKAGKPALVARRRLLEEQLSEAKAMKESAEALHAEYTERLARMDEELEQIRAEMLEAGKADRARIVADAEARAAAMRKDTEFQISQRMKQLREDLKVEAVESAIQEAERLLREATAPADQARLADDYLTTIKTAVQDPGPKELSR